MTRGERNNNPGNVKANAHFTWKGQLGVDDEGFCIFKEPKDGYRAMAVILRNYQHLHNLHTIRELLMRWTATDQETYIPAVAGYLGKSPEDVLDLDDQSQVQALCKAITRQEQGGYPWPDLQIEAGVAGAFSPNFA